MAAIPGGPCWSVGVSRGRHRGLSCGTNSMCPEFVFSRNQRNLHLLAVFSVSSFDFTPPPIDHDLLDNTAMMIEGAKVSEDGVIETYSNDEQALDAFYNGLVVADLSHFGRIRVSGEDRISFLHNQSTADFECLHEGEGCDTVFLTPTARTIDIAHAWIMKNAVTLVVSPATCKSIAEMLERGPYGQKGKKSYSGRIFIVDGSQVNIFDSLRYIFFADKVVIQDITKQTCFFVLLGPKSSEVMKDLNLGDITGQPYGSHKHYSVSGLPVTVGVGNLLSEEGFSILTSPAAATSVWNTLLSHGAVPMGANAWERLRILQGRPVPGKELTKEYNVLEAGLWNSISLEKGCYKGQETISRLITYDGIKQRLWGIRLSAPAEPDSPIMLDGKKVGKLTSCTASSKGSEYFGLGYIRRQVASAGSSLIVGGDVLGTVAEVPFLSMQSSPVKK